jgi:hypothetical protein
MITLNTDKGLVSIKSWQDILDRPGFKPDIDPHEVGIKAIIGSYMFKDFIPCGLSTCHQPHGRGYLVVLVNGQETNIGNGCGKTHFSVDFETMRVRFDKDVREKEQRERLIAALHQLPATQARVTSSIEASKNVNKRCQALVTLSKGVPQVIVDRMTQMARARNGALTSTRLATERERDQMKETGQLPKDGPAYVTETIGIIDGIAALYPENNLRTILVTNLDAPLADFAKVDVDVLTAHELAHWAKWIDSVEPNLKAAEEALAFGNRLLERDNLEQLALLISTREDIKAFKAFLADGRAANNTQEGASVVGSA